MEDCKENLADWQLDTSGRSWGLGEGRCHTCLLNSASGNQVSEELSSLSMFLDLITDNHIRTKPTSPERILLCYGISLSVGTRLSLTRRKMRG